MLLGLMIVLKCTLVTLALWNSAQWKPTSQSTTHYNGYSWRAVDGNKAADFSEYSCSHTRAKTSSWWMVDLLGNYQVKQVNVVNRFDSRQERLVNFRIEFFETDPRKKPQFPNVTGRTCAIHGSKVLPAGDNVFTCAPGTVGRFGMVAMEPVHKHPLTMCEFEALVQNAYSTSIYYNYSKNVRATESVFLSLQTNNHLTCAAECNSRRDKELCTAFNWNQERRECRLLNVSPYEPVNQISEVGWTLYRTTSY